MKLFGSSLFGQALAAAGIGAALMLSATASHAQAGGPFAGFDGNWSGTGTVALSNGTTENIRCKADYKVNASGLGLKQKDIYFLPNQDALRYGIHVLDADSKELIRSESFTRYLNP